MVKGSTLLGKKLTCICSIKSDAQSKIYTFEEAIDVGCVLKSVWRWGYAIFDDEMLRAWKAPLVEFRLGHEQFDSFVLLFECDWR